MKARLLLAILFALSLLLPLSASDAVSQPIGREEAAKWARWVIPLPHEMAIQRKVVAAGKPIVLTLTPDADPLERAAAEELAGVLTRKSGIKTAIRAGGPAKGEIEIVLGHCTKEGRMAGRVVPGAASLFTLANTAQAYRIVPLGEQTLALVGTEPQGVYYAAKTLKQLLSSPLALSGGQIAIPMAEITDWPDLAERGLWGGSANEDIEWLAERKMNLVESHVGLSIGPDGRGVATIPEKLLARAKRNAIKLVPIITHLEQLPPEVFVRYPQLKAVGDEAAWQRIGDVRPVCFSQPKAQEILSDWLTCLARYPDINDINVWLSENEVPCQCPKCKAINPFVLRTQLALRAWEDAKRVKPGLRLRILLTQGSYRSNAQVLAAVPKEVGITYYDGGRTYDSSREPMIYPLLEKYAAEGRWLGCYPQLTASWRIVCPWSGPQFIRTRMSEFAGKRLQCLCGYATPSNRYYEFNVTAAAEWSWNAAGRSEREFALSWATRQGLRDPEKAADWAVTLGQVGWDVYGSRVPFAWIYGGIAGLFRQGHPPRLGSGIFTYFPTKEHFDADLAACDRALGLARELQSPALIEETRVIRGLVEMLKGFYLMAEAATPGKAMTADARNRAAEGLARADRGSVEASRSLVAWGRDVAPQLVRESSGSDSRFADTVNCLQKVMTEASDVAAERGIPDPGRPYRVRRIGGWTTDDFKSGPEQKKTWEITKFVSGPRRYQAVFQYESGWYGAGIKQVALVATPAKDPMNRTELARDQHQGITGHQPKNTTYELQLAAYDPARRYFLVADLVGPPVNSPPGRSGCTGFVTLSMAKETALDPSTPPSVGSPGRTAALRDKAWTWGYVIPGTLPGDVPFVGKSRCSLETGAAMLGTPNVVFMNSNHNRNTLTAQYLDRLASSKQILCALQHGQYADTARKVSALSKQYPKIIGGLIDDFREPTGPSKAITSEETKAIYEALKSENRALRLYLVRYTWQDQKELLPFLPYFDAINLWVWVADEKPWRETIDGEIDRLRALTHKPILLGLFVHDYGKTGNAVPMNVLELQCKRAVQLAEQGKIEGFVFLQSGWFQDEDHRSQVTWIKEYLDSVCGR